MNAEDGASPVEFSQDHARLSEGEGGERGLKRTASGLEPPQLLQHEEDGEIFDDDSDGHEDDDGDQDERNEDENQEENQEEDEAEGDSDDDGAKGAKTGDDDSQLPPLASSSSTSTTGVGPGQTNGVAEDNDPDGSSDPLHLACRAGDVQTVARLLAENPTMVNGRKKGGKTPLIVACIERKVDVVVELLKSPHIDINLYKKSLRVRRTALWFACQMGHHEMVDLLIKDPRIDLCVDRSLNEACNRKSPECLGILVRYLLKNPTNSHCQGAPLHRFMNLSNQIPEHFQLLLQIPNIDVNALNANGLTPLQVACERGKVWAVEVLVDDSRVDVNSSNSSRLSPIVMLSRKRYGSIVLYMLSSSSKVNVTIPPEVTLMPRFVSLFKEYEADREGFQLKHPGWFSRPLFFCFEWMSDSFSFQHQSSREAQSLLPDPD